MIVIIGSKGQLGSDFVKILTKENMDFKSFSHKELDITDLDKTSEILKDLEFDVLINCAAYNDVDKAEIDIENANLLNCDAVLNLAKICKSKNSIFMTYSTDFVFDGLKNASYIETDCPNPLSQYGKSKFKGEIKTLNEYSRCFVIRTSWVFGIANKNFNTQVIEWSKKNDVLKIVDDQISSPTYSYDLADFSLKLLKTQKFGLYHFSNEGIASKFDQAKFVLDFIGWDGKLQRAKSSDFNLNAKRPGFSKLNSNKIQEVVGEKIPHWEDSLLVFLNELKKEGKI